MTDCKLEELRRALHAEIDMLIDTAIRTNEEPATDKQKQFMTKLEITYEPTITKKQASNLIEEKLNGGK